MNTQLKAMVPDSTQSADALYSRFLRSTFEISRLAKEIGTIIVPTSDIQFTHFSSLDQIRKIQVVEKAEAYQLVLESTIREFGNIQNSASLVWMALKHLDMVPPSDFFAKLAPDDVIEVYSVNETMLFANLRFYELCSYTLEQLYVYPWETLYRRDNSILEQIQIAVGEVLRSKERGKIYQYELNSHVVDELSSPFLNRFKYGLKYFVPLYDRTTKVISGFACTASVDLLTPTLPKDEEVLLERFYGQMSEFHLRICEGPRNS